MSNKTIRAFVLRRVAEQPNVNAAGVRAALWRETEAAFPHRIVGWSYFMRLYEEGRAKAAAARRKEGSA